MAAPGVEAPLELRLRLADLYAAYDDALDEGDYERWPDFFAEACLYKITPRENYDAGLPVAHDHVRKPGDAGRPRRRDPRDDALRAAHHPPGHGGRRRAARDRADGMRLGQSFALFETMLNETSTVFLCGRCYDRVVDDGGDAAASPSASA